MKKLSDAPKLPTKNNTQVYDTYHFNGVFCQRYTGLLAQGAGVV